MLTLLKYERNVRHMAEYLSLKCLQYTFHEWAESCSFFVFLYVVLNKACETSVGSRLEHCRLLRLTKVTMRCPSWDPVVYHAPRGRTEGLCH